MLSGRERRILAWLWLKASLLRNQPPPLPRHQPLDRRQQAPLSADHLLLAPPRLLWLHRPERPVPSEEQRQLLQPLRLELHHLAHQVQLELSQALRSGNLAALGQRSRHGLRPPQVELPRPLDPLDSLAPRRLRQGLLRVARSLEAQLLPTLQRGAVLRHSPARVALGLSQVIAVAAASFLSHPRRQARLVQIQAARVSLEAAEVHLGAAGVRLGAAGVHLGVAEVRLGAVQELSAHRTHRTTTPPSLPRAQRPKRALVSALPHSSWERLSKQTLLLPMTMKNPAERVDSGLEALVCH